MGTTPAPSTSTRLSSADWPQDAAPQRLIERLFAILGQRYGARLADMWRGGDPLRPETVQKHLDGVKRQWALDLADLTPSEWQRGIAALRDRPYVPTCPEFRLLCRPRQHVGELLDYAVAQLHRRSTDGGDVWPDPTVYWAAQRVGGYEMRTLGRDVLVKRFAAALDAVRDEGNVQPVPPPMAALPAPGKAVTDKATGRAHLAAILAGRPGRSERSLSRAREALLPVADRPDAVAKLLPDSVLAYARGAAKGAQRSPRG
ncbi:hypothetical protein U875_14145 [Pandoraea pnomenusa 3kgm]|uniref:hypothetical protein n=1 Tax=Pandoraea pnomenusa TaxID=93220 RepID=UPI0003C74FEB|nr:hypothetical protein [Pandoraea pnomenusa]AHB08506.1 hypothetical protein U875_14145 [Pandoraea pnomenusa 3kgm]